MRFRRVILFAGILGAAVMLAAAIAQEPVTPPTAPPAPPQAEASAAPKPQLGKSIDVIVLDPGHGGTDPGARGPGGVTESEIVLALAKEVQSRLQSQGLRVILTRVGNENPSYDDRAMQANGQRGAMFISLHIASTGPLGTARVYHLPGGANVPAGAESGAPAGWTRWEEAQGPYAGLSRRFAELLQIQLAQTSERTPETPRPAQVRGLRNVAAPAAAIEVSSVAPGDVGRLQAMAPAIATAIDKAIAAFRPVYEAGGR